MDRKRDVYSKDIMGMMELKDKVMMDKCNCTSDMGYMI